MKSGIGLILICMTLISCKTRNEREASNTIPKSIVGTWQLITGVVIESGDTIITNYTKNISFIKVINNTHFAFLQHDLNKGKDSTAVFVAGGGNYSLTDSLYTEHLEYCTAREWEGNDFTFKIDIRDDTLIQNGIEKVESAGVNRINIERYIRVKK